MTKKICVISNSKILSSKIERRLKGEGYTTILFQTVLQILCELRSTTFDLIIFDMSQSQNLDYQQLLELKRIFQNRFVPIIALCESSQELENICAQELNTVDIILKPINFTLLIARIKVVFSRLERIEITYQERLNQIRGNMSTIIPHEFRTAINGVVGFSNLLIDGLSKIDVNVYSKIADLTEMARAIQESGERLQRISENFLLYSQLDTALLGADRMSISKKSYQTPFAELISEIIASMENTLKENSHYIEVNVEDGQVDIQYHHLYKVIFEILDNAIKFSKSNSKIIIKGKNYGILYLVSIIDEGRGMNKEQLTQIGAYTQFERKKFEQQGAGLGLAIVRQIMEIYDGALNIQSEKNKGTTVHLSIPMSNENEIENIMREKITNTVFNSNARILC